MIFRSIAFVFLLAFLYGCKREHYCFCGNERMDMTGTPIRGTKKKAEEKCKEKEVDLSPSCTDCSCKISD